MTFLALFVKVYSGEELNNSDRNKFSEKVLSFSYLLRKTLSYNQLINNALENMLFA